MTDSSPFKFLDHFDKQDTKLFFARERETRILVADVVVSRLVVLFAPTGTGKTSLINAGVRPRLEERGYATFFVRVRRDPEQSAREELTRSGTPLPRETALEEALPSLSRRIEKPIVLFFDQFEEFFLYIDDARKGEFIDSIAALHRDSESGVHVVFSMREEFFVEMDTFRERIPTIFHSESNLRLRPFDRERAREALVGPAAVMGARIDADVVERILDDLVERDRIEPAQLQIVADSLWRRKTGNVISLRDYLGLSEHETAGNTAHVLLRRRLEEQLSAIESESVLELIQRLLPQLVTHPTTGKARTKWVRTTDELARVVQCDQSDLEGALRPLESLRFIRTVRASDQTLVELTHDYLVERIDAFQTSVRRVGPRRRLAAAMSAFTNSAELMSPETLAAVMLVADDLELGAEELRLLLRSAAHAGVDARAVFELARRRGVDLWSVVEDLIEKASIVEASRAVYLLGKIDDPRAQDLAGRALRRQGLAEAVIEELVFVERPWSVPLIAGCATRPELNTAVERALVRLTRARDPSVARAAADAQRSVLRPAVIRGSVPSANVDRDKTTYDEIASSLRAGVVAPFLGPGASLGNDHERSPPAGSRLAAILAEALHVPLDQADAASVQRLASFIEITRGRQKLLHLLDEAFGQSYEPRAIHRLLARLPAPLVIVTTNYDDLMEKAFAEIGRPLDTIAATGMAHESDEWSMTASDGRQQLLHGSRIGFELAERPVLVKVKGSVGRGDTPSRYIITEEDELDQVSRLGGAALLPQSLQPAISSRSFLFLGHSLGDWSIRMLLRTLDWRKSRRSWAILRAPSEIDIPLWGIRQAKVLDLDVNEFAEQLTKQADLPRWKASEQGFIYLSFSTEDLAVARAFAAHLADVGLSTLLDFRAISPRDDPGRQREELQRAIDNCDIFIPIISSRGNSQRSMDADWTAAVRAHMHKGHPAILPILVDDVAAPPRDLVSFQAVRAHDGQLSRETIQHILMIVREGRSNWRRT